MEDADVTKVVRWYTDNTKSFQGIFLCISIYFICFYVLGLKNVTTKEK
jgi:hypothetical protein